jgi:hypothetical protein
LEEKKMKNTSIFSLLLFLCYYVSLSHSFAIFMTDTFCSTPLRAGQEMMGAEAINSDEVKIIARKDGKIIENGSVVDDFTGIIFETDPPIKQSVLEIETEGVQFVDGGCEGKNRIMRKGTILADTTKGEVIIFGGWARSLERVKITPRFTLYHSKFKEDF